MSEQEHKTFVVNYGKHTVTTNIFYESELYCPFCGTKNLWREEGEGDYYMGASYHCMCCSSQHNLDASGFSSSEILEALMGIK